METSASGCFIPSPCLTACLRWSENHVSRNWSFVLFSGFLTKSCVMIVKQEQQMVLILLKLSILERHYLLWTNIQRIHRRYQSHIWPFEAMWLAPPPLLQEKSYSPPNIWRRHLHFQCIVILLWMELSIALGIRWPCFHLDICSTT